MKKILTYIAPFVVMALLSCRDESLSPLPGWEPAVHGFGVFDGVAEAGKANIADNAKNFPKTGQDADAAKMALKIRWVSLDNKLTVSKIDVYVNMIEFYTDPDGNPKQVSLGVAANGIDYDGKLLKTLTPVTGNREWNSFTVSPAEVYNLFKDATVKYDKVNAVKVFANPANSRPTGKWFNGTEKIVLTWRLTTTDGTVFKVWESSSVCADPTPVSAANANCSLTWDVK